MSLEGALLLGLALVGNDDGSSTEAYIEQARKLVPSMRGCRAPSGEDEEIVVCGRRDNDRYRLKVPDTGFKPKGAIDSVSRERNRLFQEGDAGIGSCSTVGPGGWTGCGARDFKRSLEQEGK